VANKRFRRVRVVKAENDGVRAEEVKKDRKEERKVVWALERVRFAVGMTADLD
jgi:hypothetical protein